ncbi:MAG: peptidylprolyl isomerase [Gammaproteobacteria bacterium]|nr:peptidylprolyl isomerase [Gammaproteobacteria bacterium]
MRILTIFLTLFLSFQSQAKLDDGLYANLHTNQGDIVIKLAYDKTPLTVINFVGLAEGTKKSNIQTGKPFYDGLKFHRVIDNFMVQGGDPKGNGTGGPGYQFADEITDLSHDSGGILSMANSGPDTNGSQFFITHKATGWLDGKHTVFGRVVDGMDVVNRIDKGDFIRKVEIIRIGVKAEGFKTDEIAFKQQAQKTLNSKDQAKEEKLKNFQAYIDLNYPDATQTEEGFYYQIKSAGHGKKIPVLGKLAKVNYELKLEDGTVLRKAGRPLLFVPGTGQVVDAIDKSVMTMTAGEKRTVVAPYFLVFGDDEPQSSSLNKESILIFELELLSK